MKKRIGFVCRQLVLKKPSGGIINGILSAIREFKALGHEVDLITDKPLENTYFEDLDVRVITAPNIISTRNHSELFQFKDSFNFERCILYREALKKAMTSAVYDMFVCNEVESVIAVYNLGLKDYITTVNWMHEPGTYFPDGMKDVYTDAYFEFIDMSINLPIYHGCTSERNKKELEQRIKTPGHLYTLELPISDTRMLEPDRISYKEKEGVLFNGRIETRKNPELFLKTLVKIREKYGKELKAKVLTRTNHIKKFEDLCEKYNYTNYEIKADVLGDEKFDFIESAKVGFAPSKQETFGIAAFESLRYHPTVLLNDYNWYLNFIGYTNLEISDKKNVVDLIWRLHEDTNYNQDTINKVLNDFRTYQQQCLKNWVSLLNVKPTGSYSSGENSNLIKNLKSIENTDKVISLENYFHKFNSKEVIYLSDIECLYYNRDKYNLIQLPEGSILTTNLNLSEIEVKDSHLMSKDIIQLPEISDEFFG